MWHMHKNNSGRHWPGPRAFSLAGAGPSFSDICVASSHARRLGAPISHPRRGVVHRWRSGSGDGSGELSGSSA